MIQKKQIKIIVDMVMSVVLLFLLAFQVTGDKYHEWIGAGMLVLFLLHNALNIGWYKSIFKGRYSLQRGFRTVVNLLVLIAIVLTGYSGINMSHHVFDFLPLGSGLAIARIMHLSGSYWSFVLMSIHLGMHWSMVLARLKSKAPTSENEGNSYTVWILRAAALAIAVYGAVLFGRGDIFSYMFLQNEFAMLDYEKAAVMVLLENLAMMGTWVFVGHYLTKGIEGLSMPGKKERSRMVHSALCLVAAVAVVLCGVVNTAAKEDAASWGGADEPEEITVEQPSSTDQTVPDGFVLISGGTYLMGSPDAENWRSPDETQHEVTVSDFYMSIHELTQEEYESVTGENPSTFSGANLPVENISWLDAVAYCNARSEQEGLTPVYQIDGSTVTWNRGADGYRLPTEAEWEYACRAGTDTPFNTETSISPEESNYYGHYPYEIEGNYFDQDNLTTLPGEYRQTTVEVNSFSPNAWGLYNMHGNVGEWVWDYYGDYEAENTTDPTGPATGTLRVYRGGGWNDFAKNMRSAYRATLEEDMGSFNIGIRLVRNAASGNEDIVGEVAAENQETLQGQSPENILIAYFSWGGNTEGVAEEIQSQTGADLFEITLTDPYSSNYNTVLDEAQHDQNVQARPEIAEHIDNMDEYDTVLIGYPNWWASIPMPIATFLEEYDFSGKTVIPFCSHGGGRFGQSLTAIAKLVPDAAMGEGLAIHYSGGDSLPSDVEEWLEINGIQ